MLKLLKTRIARLVIVVAAIVGIYALAGFVLAPKLARNALLEDIPKLMDVTASVGDIHVNPFLLQLDVKDFALADKGGGKLLGFGRLFVDFQLSSIWHRAYSFKRIEITSPYVNAVVQPDGAVNLLALRPKPGPPQSPPAASSPPPALRVGSFKITAGSLNYEDRSRPTQFAARLAPVNFELDNFVSGVAGGLFTLTAVSTRGERIDWHGHLSIQPIESDGEIRIGGLEVRTLWDYLEDQLNFAVGSGSINLEANYRLTLSDAIGLQMNLVKASLTDLSVGPRDSAAAWVRIPQLSIAGVHADLGQRQALIDSVACSGLKVDAWLEPNGSLNLLSLLAPRSPPGSAPTPQAPTLRTASAAGAAPPAAGPWRVELKQLDLEDAGISAEDRGTHPAAKLVLAPLSLKVGGASLDLAKPVDVRLDTRISGGGSLAVSGALTPKPLSASLDVALSGLDLSVAQPYIAQRTSVTLRSGKLGGRGKLRLAPDTGVSFAGDLDIGRLHTVDETRHQDLIRWERLDLRGLDFRETPARLDIAEVLLRKPYARVIIEADDTLNVKNVMQGPVGGRSTLINGASAARPAAAPAGAKTAASASSAAPMSMAIRKLIIKEGLANFTDHSVSPNFSAAIQQLQGSVLGLSSKPGTRAKVDLHGNVDAYSPVSINGEVNLLSAALYTDLAMDFRNIELSIFNPYSGKFAGYNISKGKLTTELHYKVDGRKLDAQHHIVIDQLEFGDKTQSKDAVSLPIKLAVALLKDRNGVIDLNLPVTGSLDDPKFRLGPIIWKVFVNILEKAVTAPFALLGSLFGGGPDLQFIDFKPGASTLDASQATKVQAIVKALQERPKLNIEVPIAAVPQLDRPALLDAELEARLHQAMAQAPHRKQAQAPGTESFDQLDADAKLELLTRVFRQELGGAPTYPDAVNAGKPKAEQVSAKIDFLTAALREHLRVTDDALRTLGEQRAQVLQQALLRDSQIAPERVFLVANDKATAKDGEARLELSLR